MAALKAVEANEEQRDETPLETDPEKLDAIAAVLERSASWFPVPGPERSSGPSSEREASTEPPESRVRASSRPLGKKERRELERKQHVLSAQRANEQRRERRSKRERLRTERLAARKQAAMPKIAAAKVAPRAVATQVEEPPQPLPPEPRVQRLLAWLRRKL